MTTKCYINDFCEDLNYKRIILYIRNVNQKRLLEALKNSGVNETHRLEHAFTKKLAGQLYLIYVENCDLHDLDRSVYKYFSEGYEVYTLYEDKNGFYVEFKFQKD